MVRLGVTALLIMVEVLSIVCLLSVDAWLPSTSSLSLIVTRRSSKQRSPFVRGTTGGAGSATATAIPVSEHGPHRLSASSSFIDNVDIVASASAVVGSSASVNAAALRAIFKLLATAGIGTYAGRFGLLDKTALSVLSKLVFGLFQPCLLFCNVAATIAKLGHSKASLGPTLILPLAALLQIFLGFGVGKLLNMILYGKKESPESKQVLACTTFGNSGPLPLVFVDALLKAHKDHTILPRSVGYVSLYLLGWSPIFWILAPTILQEKEGGREWSDLLKKILSPPILGAIAGLVFGSIPFLRDLFLPTQSILNPVYQAMLTIGSAYLPAVLLILAGSLAQSAVETQPAAASDDRSANPVFSKENISLLKQIIGIYSARFLLMPLVGFGLVGAIKKYWPQSAIATDPLLVLVLLLETCMPSAQNSTVILQLQGNYASASRMARLLMIIYILGVPAMSFWLAKILLFTRMLA
jgi:auxin efflux carrier family protein